MASLAKARLSLGLATTAVRVESARTPAPPSFKTTCAGQPGKTPHDLVAVKMPKNCAHCGDLPYGAELGKAREVGGGLVPVSAEEIGEAKAANDDRFKKAIDLLPVAAEDVFTKTSQGEKLYQLIPDAGEEDRYALLHDTIAERLDLAFTAMFTVKTRAAMYVVRARDGVLLLEERTESARLKPLPQLSGQANPQLLPLVTSMVDSLVIPFDPATYEDGFTKAIDALVAEREPVAQQETATATVTPIRQTDNDLMAALAALAPAQKKAPARRKKDVAA